MTGWLVFGILHVFRFFYKRVHYANSREPFCGFSSELIFGAIPAVITAS